jgi:predicted ester cyclase
LLNRSIKIKVHHPEFGVNESLEEALEGLKLRVTMFPDQYFTVEDMFVKRDKLVWRGVFSGTHTGDIKGFPAR